MINVKGVSTEAPAQHLLISRPALPDGATVTCWAGSNYVGPSEWRVKEGRWRVWNAGGIKNPLMLISGLPVGRHEITINFTVATEVVTATHSVTVAALPNYRDIPALQRWQSVMVESAAKWSPTGEEDWGTFSWEGAAWYYDGIRVYLQVYEWTGDERWLKSATNMAEQYCEHCIAAKGQLPGYRVFSRGLRMMYERTQEEGYREAIRLLSGAAYAGRGGMPEDWLMRETAYSLDVLIDAQKIGLSPPQSKTAKAVDFLISIYVRIFIDKSYTIHETLFDGLAAHSLIDWYELTGDLRIPPMMKLMLDWTWEHGWDRGKKKLVYNPDPIGPTCKSGCQVYYSTLINLTAPAFAWYGRTTGETEYLARGDEMFAVALTAKPWSGKEFSQNYRWSFDYVRWRYPLAFAQNNE